MCDTEFCHQPAAALGWGWIGAADSSAEFHCLRGQVRIENKNCDLRTPAVTSTTLFLPEDKS